MGGRGASSNLDWKDQLRQMARQGKVPGYIMGTQEQQAQAFIEIDRLYDMPQTKAQIIDQGDGVWVNFGYAVFRSSYPSGENASGAEKRGVLKRLLHLHK